MYLRIVCLVLLASFLCQGGARVINQKPHYDPSSKLFGKRFESLVVKSEDLRIQSAAATYQKASPLPLYNIFGFEYDYYSLIMAGSAVQIFAVVFDTDSSGIWIPSMDCQSEDCTGLALFNEDYSITYRSKNTSCKVAYGSTNASGLLGQDTFQIAGLMIENQTFCEVTQLNSGSHLGQFYDGVVGLSIDSSNSVIKNIFNDAEVGGQIFSIFLNQNLNAWPRGELRFGSVDPSFYVGEFTYAPLTNSNRWQFKVDGYKLDQHDIHNEGFEAVIASRQIYISGPHDEIVHINERLGFKPVYEEYFSSTKCDLTNSPNVTFTIGGVDFTLTPDQYAIRFTENAACLSVFKLNRPSTGPDNLWTFGSVIFKPAYTVFDYENKRIGFAHANTNVTIPSMIAAETPGDLPVAGTWISL